MKKIGNMKSLKNKAPSLKRVLKRGKTKPSPTVEQGTRITNDTVAQHREQILNAGKRFKYPLQHSKRRILVTSVLLVLVSLLIFGAFTWWQLYKSQASGTFIYRVTSIIPMDVATVDGSGVRYSDYLTILRSNMHYLDTQEGVNFKTADGQRQLASLRTRALAQAIQDAYVEKLAGQYHIAVTNQELNQEVGDIMNQQAYANSQQLYGKVIQEYYDLTFDQWKDSIKVQMLQIKVFSAIDTNAQQRAQSALSQLNAGADFSTLAKEVSDDPAGKASGGIIGTLQKGKADLPIELENALFSLKTGQISGIIPSQQGLFILKAISVAGDQVQAADIFFKYTAFNQMLTQLQQEQKIKAYIPVQIDLSSLQSSDD
jgi:parvulin-like peptidyl-prolyl isomerase